MEKMEKRVIADIKLAGIHTSSDPDLNSKIELYWLIKTPDGHRVYIYLNRFEVYVPGSIEDPLVLVIPLNGNYKNEYAMSAEPAAADKAFEAAYGLIKAMGQLSYAAMH